MNKTAPHIISYIVKENKYIFSQSVQFYPCVVEDII